MSKTLLALITATAALVVPAWAQSPVHETRSLAPDGTVAIENLDGSVQVTGWSQGEVEVTGTLSKEAERLEVTGDVHRLKIRVVLKPGTRMTTDSDLEVHVPAACRVEVECVSASIAVAELRGQVELESVSGDVSVTGTPGELAVEAVSGTITVEAAPNKASLESVSGDIEVARAGGSLEASSVSGAVRILGGTLEGGEVSTTSGEIRLEADLGGRDSLSVESMSGGVVLVVPAGVNAEFELSTFSGSISSQLGPKPERSSDFAPGEELSFSAGSGGPHVDVSSFSGSVQLLTR